MTSITFPASGTNLLTERLIREGCDPQDDSTWPEDVYSIDGEHFVYRWEWRFAKVWAAPCGVMHKGHAHEWGALWAEGTFHCRENNNPLMRCPYPGRKCPHRKPGFPLGINCEFHMTDAPYDETLEIDNIERERAERALRRFETQRGEHPGYDYPCMNERDGKTRWLPFECIRCQNRVCPARSWMERDLTPVNIYYDLETERRDETGLIPNVSRTVRKGMRVFEKPIPRTEAEMCLQIWRRDPSSPILPGEMTRKLRAYTYVGAQDIDLMYRKRFRHENIHITLTIRNIYIARQEQRDLMADLAAVRDGAEVVHDSDEQKAAKQQKTDRRRQNEIEKIAKLIANGSKTALWGYMDDPKESKAVRERKRQIREAAKAMAAEITAKRERKEAQAAARGVQIGMFDDGEPGDRT